MSTVKSWPSVALVSGCLLVATACDSMGPEPDPIVLEVQEASDVPADPASSRDPVTGAPVSNNLFTLYDLEENEIVLPSSETDSAIRQRDSTSTVWDIGFRGTTIIFNGGSSGPGESAAQLLSTAFSSVTQAPQDGYLADGENEACPAIQTPIGTVPGQPLAICTGSDNGWYNYNSSSGLISPIPGRTIVLKTATGNFAKIRIMSYYLNNPNPPDPEAPARYYTFEFIVQPDGSRDFSSTTAR